MTPERWQQIKQVLASALELPPAERAAYLEHGCSGDIALRHEVDLLLAGEAELNSHFLSEAALAGMAAIILPEEPSPWIGRRVGAYQIVEQIGAGGMGEVYKAFRADDQYQQQVALKVVRAGQDSGFVVSRFRNERQILASLDHPNIARLLDGGTTEGGAPYFVMELIDGRPIGEYCDNNRQSVSNRLALFVSVCEAVQYAHQRLIVHRDIKPGNILVTSKGIPKLLDFGVAKIFDLEAAARQNDSTLTIFRALTPGYASPEQIQGEPITTTSDVYSLGVVLYELLTGRSPYPVTSRTSQEVAQAVCQFEPEKPSGVIHRALLEDNIGAKSRGCRELSAARDSSPERLQKRLKGDLDNIVLMALRKEPSRRYVSVEQFAEDIRRHLRDIPVIARQDTMRYRTAKFVTRHSTGVAASALVALSLSAGLGVTLHEARVARQQAEIARVQKARAEQRFNDVRKLANSLMFEVHDSIKDLPGATPARKLLVTRALEYLDDLSGEARGDLSLQRELAAAYDRVGDVLGYDGAANLGDFHGALQNYDKALAIRQSAAADHPADKQLKRELLSNYFRLAHVRESKGDYAAARKDLQQALPVAQELADLQDPRSQDALAGIYWYTANLLSQTGDYPGALENYRKSSSIREPIASGANPNRLYRAHLAADYNGMGQMLARTGDTSHALEPSRKGVQILQELTQSDPTNATLREYLGEAYDGLIPVLEKHGDFDESLDCGRKALQIFANLLSADPANWLARTNLGFAEVGIGDVLVTQGKIDQAIPHIQNALADFRSIEHKTRYDIAGQAESYSTLAMAYTSRADHEASLGKKAEALRQARTWFQESLRTWQEDPNHGSPDPFGRNEGPRVVEELAKCESKLDKLKSRSTSRAANQASLRPPIPELKGW